MNGIFWKGSQMLDTAGPPLSYDRINDIPRNTNTTSQNNRILHCSGPVTSIKYKLTSPFL